MSRFVAFRVGERPLALRIEDVLGFAREIKWCRLPFAPRGVVGIANWRGRICPLIDPGVFLDTISGGGPWVCACQGSAGPIAILVDSVMGIETGEITPVSQPPFIGICGEGRLVLDAKEIERLCGI